MSESQSLHLCTYPECRYSSESEVLLQRHRRRVHSDARPTWNCDFKGCDASFTNRDNLARHVKNVHSHERWSCTECDAKFAHALVYRVHCRSVHSQEPRYECDLCNLSLPTATLFLTHRMHVHGKGGAAHVCPECSLVFQSKWHLRRHKCPAVQETAKQILSTEAVMPQLRRRRNEGIEEGGGEG